MKNNFILIFLFLFFNANLSHAQISNGKGYVPLDGVLLPEEFQIIKKEDNKKIFPIVISKFEGEDLVSFFPSAIIRSDLERSGAFRLIDAPEVIDVNAMIQIANWKSKGADALVVGRINKLSSGLLELRFRLIGTSNSIELSSFVMTVQPQFLRFGAHKIANEIFYKLTGTPGAFDTRIAYSVKDGAENRLEIADSDGENPIAITRSSESLISPSWSPDGTKLAYVSFERKKSDIFIQELANSRRIILADLPGDNVDPDWSPDGKSIVFAILRDGETQIFKIAADGTNLHRLTHSNTRDKEPRFSPNGSTIFFTRERGGESHIYTMHIDGSDIKKITFQGNFNSSPRISPDGNLLAYISLRDGKSQLYVMNLTDKKETLLSDENSVESLSFSPNGKYIMYSSKSSGKSFLFVSIDGRVRFNLTSKSYFLSYPAWGPLFR